MTHTSMLIPSENSSTKSRSWRRTVSHALASAQSAVELDSKKTDPMGALDAYTESVHHLRNILARLERHGAHAEAAQLASICESYYERMRLLCVACAVPPPPYDYPGLESNRFSSPLSPTLPPPPAYDEPNHVPMRWPRKSSPI